MTKHAPVPYGYFKSQESRFFQAEKWAITGPDHDHEESWDIVADGIPDEATARFIVTACNNYEQVLEALEQISKASLIGREIYDVYETMKNVAIEAIRQVEESAK